MLARHKLLAALAAIAALLFMAPAAASASGTQETIFQDDGQLIYSSPRHMAQTLRQLKALGVDRVKASLVWWLVAPNPQSTHRPRFNAADPAAYPPGAWERYDMLVRMSRQLGLKVYFEISPPDPLWALARGFSTREGPPLGHVPDARLFEQFVQAAGRRYSGTYAAGPPLSEPSAAFLGIPAGSASAAQPVAIPRVDYWGIWNEPNERSWLNPWRRPVRGHRAATIGAALYRGLLGAGFNGLAASGHNPRRDTILIGEIANVGILTPTPFVRALYCIGANYHPLRGLAAIELGCPASGNRRQFVSGSPGLFRASGFALHPYGFDVAPNRPYHDRAFVTLDNLGSFGRLLSRIFDAYGQHRRGGVPLYLTEWGYKTRPPNPFFRTTLAQQQTWLDQGAYMAWQRPYVRSLAQFLLLDDKPKPHTRRGSASYWSTFQTGLEYSNGKPKPAFATYPLPIWLPSSGHRHLTVWGQLRAADHSGLQQAVLQYQPRGSRSWSNVRAIQTTSREGFLVARLSLPAPGTVRLSWSSPAGVTHYSRTVRVK
jgi:hypothetical protein